MYRNCTGKNSQHPDNLYREQSQHPNSDGTPPHCTFLKQCHGTPPAPSEANLGLHMGLSNTVDIVKKPQCCFLGAKRRSWSPLMTSPGEGRRVELRDLPKIVQPCTPPITLITLITRETYIITTGDVIAHGVYCNYSLKTLNKQGRITPHQLRNTINHGSQSSHNTERAGPHGPSLQSRNTNIEIIKAQSQSLLFRAALPI